MSANPCPKCKAGWVCEEHPELPWPHDACPGPGMPCPEPGCEMSLLGLTPADPEAWRREAVAVKATGATVLASVVPLD